VADFVFAVRGTLAKRWAQGETVFRARNALFCKISLPKPRAFRRINPWLWIVSAIVAVQHRGELVADLWGGIRDPATGAPWEEDTMVLVFSATKGISGHVMA
jgi:hypothetical protein